MTMYQTSTLSLATPPSDSARGKTRRRSFRDLRLADADGKTFYVNKLDSEDVFAEFGVASNQYEWVPFSFYCRKSLLS